MSKSKIVTPTLLFLMTILLIIMIYFNILYRPMETKIDALSLQNELVKNQRLELELAMHNLDNIKSNMDEMKEKLKSREKLTLINGGMLADDIAANAKVNDIHLSNITIGDPQLASETTDAKKALIFLPASLSFITSYDKGTEFIAGFENSQTGAYQIISATASEAAGGGLMWQVVVSLYYYADPDIVPEVEDVEESGQLNDSEAKEWIQLQ